MNWLIVASLTVGLPTGSSAAKFNQDDLFKTAQTPNASGAFASTVSTINATDKAAKARQYLPLANSKIAQEPNNDQYYWARAQIYRDLGDYSLAVVDMDKAISLSPAKSEYYVTRANLFALQNKLSSALEDINRAIELKPGRAESFSMKASYLHLMGRYKESIATANQSIILNPKLAESYAARGSTKFVLKDYKGAESDCRMAESLSPGDPSVKSLRTLISTRPH